MRAVLFVPGPGGAGVELREVPQPVPAAGEVLVRVRAAGLNRGELVVKKALVAGAPQQTGIEFAGEVAAPGAGASRFKAGDRVMGHWKAGQAEYVAVDERLLVPVPARLSWVEAGAWLNVFCTAHDAIVTNAGLKAGESVLVNAVSSGIGVAALQIARLLGAQPVIGSSRTPAKLAKLGPCGMTVGVVADGGMTRAVLDATGGNGVDVLIDNVGGTVLGDNLKALALKGRMVSVGRLGANVGAIDLDYLALRRIKLIGVTFRTRTLEERIACVQRCAEDLLPALADGRLNPVVQRSFKLHEVAEAHACMERDEHIGKLVLEIG
jgi:NADPH2:quinone reductase